MAAALSYRLLLAVLGLSAILLVIPFFLPGIQDKRTLDWAPGYWELLPEIGLVRKVPFAPGAVVNPAAESGSIHPEETKQADLPHTD